MEGVLPGNMTNFENFKPENRDKPCLRLYVYRSVKWRDDQMSIYDLEFNELRQPNNVVAEFEIWDSEYNKNPETEMYKFHLNFQLNDEYIKNLASCSMETLVAWTTWGASSEWTEDEYKPRKKKPLIEREKGNRKVKHKDDYRSA